MILSDSVGLAALAGLLHDVGKFGLRAASGGNRIWDDQAKRDFKYKHAMLSAGFVDQWVPAPWRVAVSAAVGNHHRPRPDQVSDLAVTLADILSAAERDDGTQVFGFTSSSKWGAVEYYPLMYIDGGRILSEDGKTFVQNQPEGVSALDKLASLALEHKVTPPDFGTVDQAGVRSQFKDIKNVAMLMSTPGFIPDLEKENFPLAVVPPPMGDMGKLVTNGAMGLFAVVDVEDQDQLKAAHELAKYLTGSQVAKDVEGWQLAPGLRRSNTSYATTPSREVIAKLVEFGVYEVPVAVPAEVGTNYGAMLQAIILGEMTGQEAMDAIAEEYQAALDEANK